MRHLALVKASQQPSGGEEKAARKGRVPEDMLKCSYRPPSADFYCWRGQPFAVPASLSTASPTPLAPSQPLKVSSAEPVLFRDSARESGLDFLHENGAFGKKWLPETMGSGVAFLDYDNDGDQDLFLVNG